ncbi:MAG: CBS domain-containing protein [Anaerolineales bacterium]|nr:CBS domain-containing protein [Anaerolineales bacterium]
MIQDPTVLKAKRLEVYACKQSTTLREACCQIAEEDISCLVVTDDAGFLTGILTRADLLRARLTHENWLEDPVAAYMNADVITVAPETTLSNVARLLLDHHIHRVVITRAENGHQLPLGVISDSDLIYHMASQINP